MRGLATLPQGGSRSLWWSKTWMEDPQEDPHAVHCFCVCSGSALLGDLLGESRSIERDLLCVLSIYPRICVRVLIVYRLLVGFLSVLLYSTMCSCVLVVYCVTHAMHKHSLCCLKMAGCHTPVLSKRLQTSSDFFLGLVSLPL